MKPFLSIGQWTLADGSQQRVVVRYRPGSQERERQALELAAHHHIPAPHFLASLELAGGTYLVQSFLGDADFASFLPPSPLRPVLPGEQISSRTSSLDRAELLPLLQELGRVCARLHQVTVPGFGNWLESSEGGDGVAFTLARVQTLLGKSQERTWLTSEGVATVWAWVSERMTTLFSPEESPRFIHADLHPANVRLGRVSDTTWQVQGLIDFEHAKGWYPEYDLVVLRWHLVDDEFWSVFVRGYGEINAARLRTCEVIKLLMILSGWPREYAYAQWAYQKLQAYFPHLMPLSLSASPHC